MSRTVRVVAAVVVIALAVWLLFTVVFPWFDARFVTDPVLDASAASAASAMSAMSSERAT